MKLHLPMTLLAALLASFSFTHSSVASELTWAGTNSNIWTLNGSADTSPWENGAIYTNEDTVIFGTIGTEAATREVLLSGTVAPAGMTFNSDLTSYTLKGDGALGGNGSLTKSGASALRLETLNPNFSGAINLDGGILELGADGVLGTGKITWGGGTIKYGTGVTTDISNNMNAAANGKDTIRVNTNGNNVVWSAANRTGFAYIKSGEGALTIKPTGAATYTKNLTIEQGELIFDTSRGNTTINGQIDGNGRFEKTGTNSLILTNSNTLANAQGIVHVSSGTLQLGSGSKLEFTGADIVVGNAILRLEGNSANHHSVANNLTLHNGAEIYIRDASAPGGDTYQYDLSGSIQIGESASDIVDLRTQWGKNIALSGTLSGEGTLQFLANGSDGNEVGNRKLFITHENTAFTGTVSVGPTDASGDTAAKQRALILAHQNALVNASVNLVHTGSHLYVNNAEKSANIAGLYGQGVIEGKSSGATAANPDTLNLIQKDKLNTFTGTLADTISLVKSGAGTFVFSGTNNGRLSSSAGTLQLGQAAGDYTAGNISVTGGALNLGGTGTIANVSVSSLTLGSGANIFMDINGADHDQLTYTGTTAVELNGLSFNMNLSASTGTEYTLFTTTTGSFSTTGGIPQFIGLNRGAAATLALGADNKSVVLTITNKGTTGNLNWNGTGDSHVWMTQGNAAASPWTKAAGTTGDPIFYAGDAVTFGADAANKTVTVTGEVVPGNMTVSAGGYIFEGTGSITGNGKLTVNAAAGGTLTINTSNLYSGGTDLQAGAITLGDGKALGTGTIAMASGTSLAMNGSMTVANAVGMTGDNTISVTAAGDRAAMTGVLANTVQATAGKLIKDGAGTLALTGSVANTYTGGTQIKNGTLEISRHDLLGTGGVVLETGGTLSEIVQGENKLLDNTLTGSGILLLVNTMADQTDINKANFSEFAGGIVLQGTQRYKAGNGSNLSHVRTIEVKAGSHLYMGGGTWNQNFTIAGTGTGSQNDRIAALRMDSSAVISGSVTLSADANIVVYTGSSTISGNLIGGGNVLTFRTSNDKEQKLTLSGASLAAKGISSAQNGTLVLGGGTGDGNRNTVAELGAGGLNLNAGTDLQLNNVTIRATEQWAQHVGSGTVTLMEGTTNTLDTNGTNISFDGALGGTGSLVKDGDGALSIAEGSNYSGTTTVNGGVLNLNGAALAGEIALTYGSLAGAQNAAGNVSITQATAGKAPSSISMGGMGAEKLQAFTGAVDAANDTVTRVTDIGHGALNLTNATLGISSGMTGTMPSDQVFSFTAGENGTVTLGGVISLMLTDEAATALLDAAANTTKLGITNGNLNLSNGTTVEFNTPYHVFSFIFSSMAGASGGSLVLSAKADDDGARHPGWLVVNTGENNTDLDNAHIGLFSGLQGIHNNGMLAINVTGTETATLNNLEGSSAGAVVNTGANADLTVSLTSKGGITNSTYRGSITGSAALVKNGDGYHMSIGGRVEGKSLTVANGSLEIGGALLTTEGTTVNTGSTLTLNGTNSSITGTLDVQGTLILGAGATVQAAGLSTGADTSLSLGKGSELSISSSTTLTTAVTGTGTLNITGAGSAFSLGTGGSLDRNVTLGLNNGASTTLANDLALGGLEGNGNVTLGGHRLVMQDATATFSGTFNGAGTVEQNGTGHQTLSGAGSADVNLLVTSGQLTLNQTDAGTMNYGTVQVNREGVLNVSSASGYPGLHVAGLQMETGSTLNLNMNVTQENQLGKAITSSGAISLGDVKINLNNTSSSFAAASRSLNFVLMEGGSGTTASLGSGYTLKAGFLSALYHLTLQLDGADILLVGEERKENSYTTAALTSNSTAGGMLLNESKWIINEDHTTNLYKLADSVSRDIENGHIQSASRTLAAAAGSTVNALGTAQRDALRDQMGWIRNRTTLMGVNPAYVNEDLPYFHMWMEGTGSYAKLDTSGDESGYELTTWGGTVGMDVDVSDCLTVGAAFTANYGDLTASAADTADGNLDSYYANLFGRYQSKRWAHTLIVTGGWNDAKLNRTVNYGAGSYSTQGNTNGWGFGAMYELTYDVYLNEDKSSVLQPLFNASIVKTSLDGYAETGAGNAGLNVGKQEWTTGTLALGGRWMGLAGSNLFGREALVELRANVAQDLGDDRGETSVGLLANPGFMQSVRGAKVGRTALQIGAGLSVPVGTQGTVFVNGNADIRDGASSLNGSIGYRYDF